MLRRSFLVYLLLASFLCAPFSVANTVSGSNGVVSSRSQIASDVGIDILRQGGNAVDAAVAVGFALAVTYPSAGNIGGGGFMVIRLEDGSVVAQDHREKAPGSAFPDMFLDDAGNVDRRKSLYSAQAAGVPGSVAGRNVSPDVIADCVRHANFGVVRLVERAETASVNDSEDA